MAEAGWGGGEQDHQRSKILRDQSTRKLIHMDTEVKIQARSGTGMVKSNDKCLKAEEYYG